MTDTLFENTLHITMDRKKTLEKGFKQLQFINSHRTFSPPSLLKSKVFKDYILSTEAYRLQ